MREVEVTIHSDGTMDFDLKGWQGTGCSDVAKKLAEALGTVVDSKKKPEFYQQIDTSNAQQLYGN